jgi:hypothetical protein
MATLDAFNPVLLSLEENRFIIDHLGEPPVVAARALPNYPNVVSDAVMPHIRRAYELIQLAANPEDGETPIRWIGVDAIKAAAKTYLEQSAKWERDYRLRKAPRFPSMYSFDSKGRPHRGGTGSDSGMVKTYFDKEGKRHDFAVEYIPDYIPDWVPGWVGTGTDVLEHGIRVDVEKERVECTVCNHTEKFDNDSPNSINLAKARMSKHLRGATTEVDAHREALQELS